MSVVLAVWLDGVRVAVLDNQPRRPDRPRLTYTSEALDQYALGTPLLSVTLPLTPEPFPQGVVKAFLEGLLPEGGVREILERRFGVAPGDTLALVGELGRECAGALVILPDDGQIPLNPALTSATPLSNERLAELIADLPTAPLGVHDRVRHSLAGVQQKLLLALLPGEGWSEAVDGLPSTHILKPANPDYAGAIQNELFCMRIAKHVGLPVAEVDAQSVGGVPMLVVERYDRQQGSDGVIVRVHQEDLCQATGTPPTKKYEEDGGPSLKKIADVLQSYGGVESIEALFRATVLNVVIANGDAHAKNFSLLHTSADRIRLAPLYDLLCSAAYNDWDLALRIDGLQKTDRVTADHLVREAMRWGLSERRARSMLSDMLDALPEAIRRAQADVPTLDPNIKGIVDNQLQRLRAGWTKQSPERPFRRTPKVPPVSEQGSTEESVAPEGPTGADYALRATPNGRAYAVVTVASRFASGEGAALGDRELDEMAKFVARVVPEATARRSVPEVAWWSVPSSVMSDGLQLWLRPGPVLQVLWAVDDPHVPSNARIAVRLRALVCYWSTMVNEGVKALAAMNVRDAFLGLSLQTVPAGRPNVVDIDFDGGAAPTRSGDMHAPPPWVSGVLTVAPASDDQTVVLSGAADALIRTFSYRHTKVTLADVFSHVSEWSSSDVGSTVVSDEPTLSAVGPAG